MVDHQAVLARYRQTTGASAPERLGGAGGFSGARFWRVAAGGRRWCLRRWPAEHPSRRQLAEMHAVLLATRRRGFELAATPVATMAGETIVERAGHLWELSPWLPGAADYAVSPGRERLAAAMRMLARFHIAAADVAQSDAPSAGLAQRQRRTERLLAGGIDTLAHAVERSGDAPLQSRGRRSIERFRRHGESLRRRLDALAPIALPQQWCIRDVRAEHVLFEGDRVSGLVDFGAMRVETVAGDVARLLGELVREGSDWDFGIAAYAQLRPLSAAELGAATAFDAANRLLAGLQWLQWICLESRRFEDPDRVLARLDQILARNE